MVLKSIATGNFLTASTWGLVDATSYLNSETGGTVVETTYSGTRSSAFTPGAITVAGIGVKLQTRTGTTGTLKVSLRNATIGLDDFVAGTEVTIDCADLPVASGSDLNGGWIYFEFATPVLLLAANDYNIQAKTSSSSQINLNTDITTDNLCRILVTTTTQAPAAGDDLIVAGAYIDQSTFNTITVTMDALASSITDYGAASTSLVTPSLAICNGGTLTWGTTAATNYYLRQSGNVIIYSGGTMNMGTVATACPRDSTQKLNFDCGANVDFGLTVRNLGTFVAQGLSRTSGKNIVSCKLNTDEAAAQTTLGVDTDTGWLSGDEIAIASTTRTASECESRVLDGNAGASSMDITAGLTNAHSGTSPTQAEVILLTRNVQIFGASASLQGYIRFEGTSTIDIDWTEFKWLGSAGSSRGILATTTTGTCNIQYSSLHNFEVTGSAGFMTSTTSGSGIVFSNNVTYLIANSHFLWNNGTSGTWIADSNIFMRNTDSANLVTLSDIGGTFTNNTMVGGASNGLVFNEASGTIGTCSGNTSHSHANLGVSVTGTIINSTISTLTSWRNTGTGLNISVGISDVTFSTLTLFGNTTNNIAFVNSDSWRNVRFISLTSNGDTTFSTTNGINFSGAVNALDGYIYSGDFSTVSGIKTAHTNDINVSVAASGFSLVLQNTKLGGTNEVATQSNMSNTAYIGSQKHDQTAGLHKTWKKYGTIIIEGTIIHSGAHAFSMTPNNASNKLVSGSFFIPVANGATLTPSVYSYENATYNGNRMRLILKRNDAIGITADVVIDTRTGAADAVWEQLTGVTAAATDDGVMEFVIDCDGTAGIAYVDSFTVT